MIWLQHWTDVLFLHFPLPEQQLRPLVTRGVAIDTYGGSAWLSYIFFRLNLRPAWLPTIPAFSSLYELNIRTYVRHRDQPGIYFLRMYADNALAIAASRLLTPLKYEAATITCKNGSNGSRSISCQPRNGRGSIRLEFRVNSSLPTPIPVESLDYWLLERYRAYVPRRNQSLLTATVEHPPWQAAPIELMRYKDDLTSSLGIAPAGPPTRTHYSPGLAARFNAFQIAAGPKLAHRAAENKEKVAGTGFEPATSRL